MFFDDLLIAKNSISYAYSTSQNNISNISFTVSKLWPNYSLQYYCNYTVITLTFFDFYSMYSFTFVVATELNFY